MATREQKIYLMHRAMFGFSATVEFENQVAIETAKTVPVLPTKGSIEVTTSLGRKLIITVNPFRAGPTMVEDYVWDKKEGVYVVVKGSKRPKVERETFSFDYVAFDKSEEQKTLRNNVNLNDAAKRSAKTIAVADAMLANILRVLPDAGEYLDVTEADAPAFLKSKGWTFGDHITFEGFAPGSWTMQTHNNFRCATGVNAEMNFSTRKIETMGWSSDD